MLPVLILVLVLCLLYNILRQCYLWIHFAHIFCPIHIHIAFQHKMPSTILTDFLVYAEGYIYIKMIQYDHHHSQTLSHCSISSICCLSVY